MTTTNPHLLPVIAPPDLPEIAVDVIDRLISEAGQAGADPSTYATVAAGDMIESGRWQMDPTNEGDLSLAEWALRLVVEARDALRQLDSQRAEFHRQIDEWFSGEVVRPFVTVAFFEPHLQHYQRRRRARDEKAATLRLPSGQVKSTRYQPSIEVDDDEAVIAWARENGLGDLLVKTTYTLRKAELNKLCQPVVQTEDGTPDGAIVDSWVEIVSVDDDSEARRVPGVHVKAGHVDVKVVPRS